MYKELRHLRSTRHICDGEKSYLCGFLQELKRVLTCLSSHSRTFEIHHNYASFEDKTKCRGREEKFSTASWLRIYLRDKQFGASIRDFFEKIEERVVFVVSGDLSHTHPTNCKIPLYLPNPLWNLPQLKEESRFLFFT